MKRKIPKKNLRKLAKLHTIFSLSLFFSYVLLSVLYSPEFLISDIRGKFQALADQTFTITGKVLAPPKQPMVSGISECKNGVLSVSLNWQNDENSQTYNIERDGLQLITGLTGLQYIDNAVSVGAEYSYRVVAIGPMGPGTAVSEPFVLHTLNECENIIPTPIEISGITISKEPGKYDPNNPNRTSLTKPTFSGSVNVPGAVINLMVNDSATIYGSTVANPNGYWSWTNPTDISEGSHILTVTAFDPKDISRMSSKTFPFEIASANNDDEDDKKTNVRKNAPAAGITRQIQQGPDKGSSQEEQVQLPIDYSISIETNPVLQGRELATSVQINKIAAEYENSLNNVKYALLDKDGKEVYFVFDQVNLFTGATIRKTISLPNQISDGSYKLAVEIFNNTLHVSKSLDFTINLVPIISLGGGFVVTYPEILSNLGTISLTFLLLLLIWIFLLSREYWLYLHSLRHITENNLRTNGMILLRKRRGVSK